MLHSENLEQASENVDQLYGFCAKPFNDSSAHNRKEFCWCPLMCKGILVRDAAAVRARADVGIPVHQIIDAGFYLVDSGEPLNAFK